MSLPSRECGLKYILVDFAEMRCLSLPSRECGLKLYKIATPNAPNMVTPLAGVWIEIGCRHGNFCPCTVTPLAGVWIEITYVW